jgi:hypothetical protein
MQRSGATSPDTIPIEKFRVEMTVQIDCVLDIPLMLAAINHGDARKRLRDLVNGKDPMLREAPHEAIVEGCRRSAGNSAGTDERPYPYGSRPEMAG